MSRILSRISMFDRADLVARLARRARPQLLRRDPLEHRVGADGDVAVDPDRWRHRRFAGRRHHLAHLEHDLAGVERLAGGVRRAHRRATAADRAGVGVEQLLPGEVLDRRLRRTSRARSPSGWAAASSRPWAGRGRRRYMFIGDVIMWRSFVVGRITRNATNAPKWTPHTQRCASRSAPSDQPSTRPDERVADERPLLERLAARRARCGTPR